MSKQARDNDSEMEQLVKAIVNAFRYDDSDQYL